jgi:hypothetical protein
MINHLLAFSLFENLIKKEATPSKQDLFIITGISIK